MNLTELEHRLQNAEKSIRDISDKLSNIIGKPIVRSYAGVRLDLNADLNVLELNKRLDRIETILKAGKE